MSVFVVDSPQRRLAPLFSNQANQHGLVLTVALAIVLSATGACDTDNLQLVHRTSLWLVICALVVSQAVALRGCLAPYITDVRLHSVVAVAGTVVLTTIELHFMKHTPFLPKEPDPPLAFLLFILPLAAPVAMLALVLTRSSETIPIDHAKASPSNDVSVAAQLESWPVAQVLRVTAQDHYLSVRTADNTVLIRGRMKDALQKLTDDHGMQIHRSHWIANSEIVRATRQGRDYRVHLSDGTALPVSRTRVAQLKQLLNEI